MEQVKHSGIALDLASDAKNYAYFFVGLMDNMPATIPASQMNSTARHSKNSICKRKNAPLVSVETHQIIAQMEDAIYLYSCHWLVDSRYFFLELWILKHVMPIIHYMLFFCSFRLNEDGY